MEIVELVKRRPCCGTVRIGQTTLAPGEATDVAITLSVGDRFDLVTHEVLVVTDPPSPGELVLRTTARAIPPIRVEREEERPAIVRLGADKAEITYRVSSYGTPAEPPIDLNRVTLGGSADARWLGPGQADVDGDGLAVQSHQLPVELRPEGEVGERRATISLHSGDQPVCEQAVAWQVVPAVAATPKVLVLRAGVRDRPPRPV